RNGGMDGSAYAVLVQPDQRVLVGGFFENVRGGLPGVEHVQRRSVARLMTDGSVDTSFLATSADPWTTVHQLLRQSDGRILVGGDFDEWQDGLWANMVRLMPDGSVDTTFVTGTGFN